MKSVDIYRNGLYATRRHGEVLVVALAPNSRFLVKRHSDDSTRYFYLRSHDFVKCTGSVYQYPPAQMSTDTATPNAIQPSIFTEVLSLHSDSELRSVITEATAIITARAQASAPKKPARVISFNAQYNNEMQ